MLQKKIPGISVTKLNKLVEQAQPHGLCCDEDQDNTPRIIQTIDKPIDQYITPIDLLNHIKIDTLDDEQQYIISAKIDTLKYNKSSVFIKLRGTHVVISLIEPHQHNKPVEQDLKQDESQHGTYQRRMTLPSIFYDVDTINATYKNGIITVTIDKSDIKRLDDKCVLDVTIK